MTGTLQDVRYALRQLRNSPGSSLVAIVTLALGIGANTAIFTLVHAVMFRSLPVANPKQLYRLGDNDNCCVYGGYQDDFAIYSYPLYRSLRDQSPEFEEMAAFQAFTLPLGVRRSGSSAPAESFVGEFVSGNYFSTFGLQPRAGRLITAADDIPAAAPVVVISYRAWQRYALERSVIGDTLNVNGVPFAVVGVLPPGFFGDTLRSDPPDFFIPIQKEPLLQGQLSLLNHADLHWLYVIGRLRPNTLPEQVQSRLTVRLRDWLTSGVEDASFFNDRQLIARTHIRLTSGGEGVATLRYRYLDALRLLIAASALVLVIACANIANLLLARSARDRQQTSVRIALGASRGRLIRQTLTESVLLSLMGGAAGLFVAYNGSRLVLLLAFRGATYVPISPSPSPAGLSFAFLVSLLTGIFFGVAPAWIASRFAPAEALHAAGRATRNPSTLPQKSLIVLQASLSFALLIGAGLLIRSLDKLQEQPLGFETQGRLILKVDPALAGYTPERLPRLYSQIEERLQQIPGVISVSYSKDSPMGLNRWSGDVYFDDGRTRAKAHEEDYAVWNRVSAHYFETIGTPVIRGRAIDERDTPTSRRVVVVNQTFVNRYFAHEEPLGRHFGIGGAQYRGEYEVTGVVGDAKYNRNAREPAEPMVFLPFFQMGNYKEPQLINGDVRSNYIQDIELRVARVPQTLEPTIRRALGGVDPNLPIIEFLTLSEQVSRNFNQERLMARLTGLFGVLALVLASVGLYGVTAYSVVQRTSEIGIRMALGADRLKVLDMILRAAFFQVALGLVIGIPTGWAVTRIFSSQLYGVKTYDPVVFVCAAFLLTASALVAAFVPARRAASIEPIQALRAE